MNNPSSNQVPDQPLDSTSLRHLQIEISQLNKEVTQLRGRSTWLLSMVVGLALLLGGATAWFFIQSQSQSEQSNESIQDSSSVESGLETDELSRLKAIEGELSDLKRQVSDDLDRELQGNKAKLQDLKEQLQEVSTQLKGDRQSTETSPEPQAIPAESSDNQESSNVQPSQEQNKPKVPSNN